MISGGDIETVPVSCTRPDNPVFLYSDANTESVSCISSGLMTWRQYGENQLQAELGKPRAEAGIINHI